VSQGFGGNAGGAHKGLPNWVIIGLNKGKEYVYDAQCVRCKVGITTNTAYIPQGSPWKNALQSGLIADYGISSSETI